MAMRQHSHDYHLKILSDFNKVQATPWRWSFVIETCRSFLSVLYALIIDTKIGVIIKKVQLLEHINIVNRNTRWNSDIHKLFLTYSTYLYDSTGL
jgi:hypothetical protein